MFQLRPPTPRPPNPESSPPPTTPASSSAQPLAQPSGPLEIRLFWPCKDGHVAITYLFGAAIGPFTDRLMQYALEEGYCDQETRDKDWLNYTNLILSGQEPISEYFRCCEVVGALCADKTKAELFQVAQERRLLIVPVSTMDDLDENEHLAARSYWRDVERGGSNCQVPGTVRPTLRDADRVRPPRADAR